jgi:hypothetical protein
MEHRINIELTEDREREMHRRTRTRWPDDGLPPRHRQSRRAAGSLHPAALIADLFWR